jgi:hypothetical protein
MLLMPGKMANGYHNLHHLYLDMNGFQDTGTRAAGVLLIGQELDQWLLGWPGFLVFGKLGFGILASGVVRILEDMDGIQGIGGLVVDGMAGVGTDLDGDRPDLDGEDRMDPALDGEDLDLDPDLDGEDLDPDLDLDSEGLDLHPERPDQAHMEGHHLGGHKEGES